MISPATKRKILIYFILLILLAIGVGVIWFMYFSGRSASRLMGKSARQVVQVDDMKRFISISYTRRGKATIKDITYVASDGYVYTREYRDVSPLEGVIRWVPHNESDDMVQTRSISRWTGGAVNLRLPPDLAQVLGVDIAIDNEKKRIKNLTFRDKQGRIMSKEYKEGFLERTMGGWLEIKAKAKQ